MKIDLSELTAHIERSLSTYHGTVPPKLYVRLSEYLNKSDDMNDRVSRTVAKRISDERAAASLVKSEVMASAYDNGELRFDFGAEVPEGVKKRAIEWAKKRGLRPVEASLTKNADGRSSYIFSEKQADPSAACVSRVRWTIG